MKSTLNTERLISCRRQLGITQTEAADRIGVSQPAYQRYEAGVRTPSIQVIKEIAKAFGVSESFLSGESSESRPDYVVVNREESPLLFSIVEQCKSFDEKQLENILHQFMQLTNGNKAQQNKILNTHL